MHVEISVGILARYTEKRVPLKEMFCRLREHKSGYLLIIGKLSHGKCTMRVHVGWKKGFAGFKFADHIPLPIFSRLLS